LSQYVVQRLASFDDVDKDEWDAVLNQSSVQTVFQLYSWNRLVWEEHGCDELILLAVRTREGVAVAFAPLFLTEKNGRKIIQMITALRGDYADILLNVMHAKISIQVILSYIFKEYSEPSIFLLEKIPPESSLLSIAPAVYRKTIITDGAVCPSLIFETETPESLSKKINNKKMRYYHRRLVKIGDYNIRHLTEPEVIRPYLKSFFDQHISRWAKTPFLEKRERDFYTSMVDTLGSSKVLIFSVLSIDEKPVGFHLGFGFHRRFIWYKPTYDIEYSKYSPGLVLMKESIQYALDSGYTEFDFAAGDESYKERFANYARQNHDISFYTGEWNYFLERSKCVLVVAKQHIKKLLG